MKNRLSSEDSARHSSSGNRRLAEEDIAMIMSRLSPNAVRTLRTVAKMRNRRAEDVLREEIEGYISDRLPLVDIEGIIRLMGARFYEVGYAVGTVKKFIRHWKKRGG